MKYYGFKYKCGLNTRFAHNGRIAGDVVVFETKKDRHKWLLDEQLYQEGHNKGIREAVTYKRAIKLVGKVGLEEAIFAMEYEKEKQGILNGMV